MNWFTKRFFNSDRSVSGLTTDQLFQLLGAQSRAKSGVVVNWQTALQVTTVMACTRKISDGNSSVPLKLYKREKNGERTEARDHPLFDLFSNAPNAWQNSMEFRETLSFHLVLTGNAFCFIRRNNKKEIVELIPIEPSCMSIRRNMDRSITYTMTAADGTQQDLTSDSIWHIRGPSWDGVAGMDAVHKAREAIGLALATEQSHASMHANGVMPSGIVSVDGNLDEPNLIRLAAWVKANFTGLENQSKAMILDRKATWTPLRMSGVDSEHLATRKMQVEEICHDLGVYPAVIGVSENNTSYASSEQMFIAHLVHTVRPWHRRLEESIDRWLLTKDERRAGFYSAFNAAAFLSPSMKDKAEFYKIALGGGNNPGWVTPNQVRSFDDMPSYPGGDKLYVPINMAPIGPDGKPEVPAPVAPPAAPAAPAKKKASNEIDRLAVGRVLSSENEQLLRDASALIDEADGKLADVLKKIDKAEIEEEDPKPDGYLK